MQDVASLVLPLGAFVLIFWLLIIRPQARRQRELSDLHASLSVGDEVMLASGIYGSVRGLDEDTALIRVSEGVDLRVARAAVARVLTEHSDIPPGEEEND